MATKKMPCELCGDAVVLDDGRKKRKVHLCERHRTFARKELRRVGTAAARKTNIIRYYPPKTMGGNSLAAE